MDRLKEETISLLEDRLQRHISYSSISPSIFIFLEMRDVVIMEKEGDKELLKVGRIRVHYSLLQLIKGNYSSSLKEISIVKSRLNFDLKKDKDLLTLFTSGKTGTGRINLPQVVLSGKNLSVTVKNGENTFVLEKFFFKVSTADQGLKFSTKGKISGKISTKWFTRGSARFKYSGSINNSLSDFNSRLALKALSTNLFSLNSLSVQIQRADELLVIRKIEDSSPLDMEISYNSRSKDAVLSIICEKFIPSDYLFSLRENKFVNNWISGIYSLDLSINYSLITEELSYKGSAVIKGKNKVLGGNYNFKTELSGDNEEVTFKYARLVSPLGNYYYQGSFFLDRMLPDGFLSVRNGQYKNNTLEGTFFFRLIENDLEISGSTVELNGINFKNIEGKVKKYKDDFDFSASFTVVNTEGPDNKTTIEGNFQYAPGLFMQLNIITDNLPLKPFNRYTGKINTNSVVLNTEGFLTTDFNKFSFSLVNVKLKDTSDNTNTISFSCTGNNDGINITEIKALWHEEELTGDFLAERKKGNYTIRADLVFNTYPYNFVLNAGKDGIFVRGNYNLLLSAQYSDTGVNFSAQSTSLPVPLKDYVTEVSVNCSGYYLNNSSWKVLFEKAVIKNLPLPIAENKLEFSGEATQNRAMFKEITFTDTLSTLYGESTFEYDLGRNNYNGSIFLTDEQNNESYSGSLLLTKNLLNLEAVFSGAPIERFKKSSLNGLVSGKFSAEGSRTNPDFQATIRLDRGIYSSNPIDLSSSIHFKNSTLSVDNFTLKYQVYSFSEGKGNFDTKSGKYGISAKLQSNIGGHSITSDLSLQGAFLRPENLQKITIENLKHLSFKGRFASQNAKTDGKKAQDWYLDLARDANSNFKFEGGPGNSIYGFLEKDGTFKCSTTDSFPVKTNAYGKIKDGKIDIILKDSRINLTAINIVKIPGFRFSGGAGYGDVQITGELRDPDFTGTLNVKGAVGELSYLIDPIEPFNTTITFSKKNMHVSTAVMKSGDADVTGEADFTFNKWVPGKYRLDFATINEPGVHLLYRIGSIGLGINGYAAGNLRIEGLGSQTKISGKLKVDKSIIALGQTEKSSVEGSSNTSVDMEFTTGRKVEVLWPSTNLPIIKANTEPDQTLHVVMDGISGTYSVKGDIAVKYGEIYYFQRNFYLTSGTIIFNENEESFDPLVDFEARIREVDSEGEAVNVYMYLDKTPLSKFSPRFESDPALPTVEIMAMLGSNVFAQLGSEKVDITSALVLTGDLVSQFSIVRGFEQKVKDIFQLDLFSIRTQMIQNIILDRFAGSGISDNTSSDLFGKYLDNTTIYLGKYFGNSLFLQTMVQLGTTSGFSEDYTGNESLQIQTTINLEWETPFFLLDLAIEPDFINPVSSLDNTSLSFSWGFSY